MNKNLFPVLMSVVALGTPAQAKGKMEVYDLQRFKLHVYYTNDALGDASYIIEGNDSLVTLEQPLFRENIAEYNAYLDSLNKPVAKRIADYHVGGTDHHEITMAEGMPAFTKGAVYGGIMQHFAEVFGDAITDLPTGKQSEVAFDSTQQWAGISFRFLHGAATDFPGASLLIGEKVYYTHWTPVKAHISPLQVGSREAIDAEIAEAERSLQSGAVLFIGGHGGAANAETVHFKIQYLSTMKRLLSECSTPEQLVSAMQQAYPDLPAANNLTDLAKVLVK